MHKVIRSLIATLRADNRQRSTAHQAIDIFDKLLVFYVFKSYKVYLCSHPKKQCSIGFQIKNGFKITRDVFKKKLIFLTCRLLNGKFWLGYKDIVTAFHNSWHFVNLFFAKSCQVFF